MADKKMTQLDALTTGLHQDDIFHLVDDPNGVDGDPANKKITTENLVGLLNYVTDGGETSGSKSFLKSSLTVNTNFTTAAGVVTPAEFVTEYHPAAGSTNTVVNLYGTKVTMNVSSAGANVTGTLAGQDIYMNLSDSIADDTDGAINNIYSGGSARVYGLQITIDDSGNNRAVKPDAFICLNDGSGYANDDEDEEYGVNYLMDLGNGSDYVVASANGESWANGHVMIVTGNTGNDNDRTADTKIRIRVNGTEYALLATSNTNYTI
jgi:small nuclear ribonucleoprotein (snRNP)-like protein